jgi:hypothetical protein
MAWVCHAYIEVIEPKKLFDPDPDSNSFFIHYIFNNERNSQSQIVPRKLKGCVEPLTACLAYLAWLSNDILANGGEPSWLSCFNKENSEKHE